MTGLVIAGIALVVLLVFLKMDFSITEEEINMLNADKTARKRKLEKEKADAEKEREDNRRRVKSDKVTEMLVQVMEVGSVQEIQKAMKNGIDILQKLESNQNLLMLAVKNNPYPEVVNFLLDQGIEINDVDDNGQTALILAATFNPNPDVVKTLLDRGADKTIKDKMKKTAADYVPMNTSFFGTDVGTWLKIY